MRSISDHEFDNVLTALHVSFQVVFTHPDTSYHRLQDLQSLLDGLARDCQNRIYEAAPQPTMETVDPPSDLDEIPF